MVDIDCRDWRICHWFDGFKGRVDDGFNWLMDSSGRRIWMYWSWSGSPLPNVLWNWKLRWEKILMFSWSRYSYLILKNLELKNIWHCFFKETVSREFVLQFLKIREDTHKSRCTAGVNYTVANLPTVSTTPVANFATITAGVVETACKFAAGVNCHRYQRHRRQICHRYQQHRWQIMRTISDCWHLKVNLTKTIYLNVNSTTHRCLK